mmetsp:Transcript_25123/g.38943  ORF Transcript_25123/g.38943 Transcript_25123/m.38943 type:complete len:87 (-) Transcript_25123:481-741(-)
MSNASFLSCNTGGRRTLKSRMNSKKPCSRSPPRKSVKEMISGSFEGQTHRKVKGLLKNIGSIKSMMKESKRQKQELDEKINYINKN